MKKTFLLLLVFTLVACSPTANSFPPTEAVSPTQIQTLTPALPTPTLPPTLTPLVALLHQPTPTALYSPLELSAADQAAYEQALKDIPLYRQGGLHITLQDEKGNPLSGYQVKYRQTSHDFLFGGVADPFYVSRLRQTGINTMTAYMDWHWIEPEFGKYDLDFTDYWLGIDELKSGGMFVRTNNLFDTSAENMAPYFRDVSYDEFLKRLDNHIAVTVQKFAPSVDVWEAILEPNFGNHNPLKLTKDQYYGAVSTSIAAIRKNDPTALIEINIGYPCGGIDWLDNYQIIQEMLERQIDFDVVGLQFYYNAYIHAGNYAMPKMSLSEMSACYDKYEKMLLPHGKRVMGSEFSVPSEAPSGQTGYWNRPWSEETQAQYLTTSYTIFFSKPSNLGLVWWNSVDPSPFVYNGGLVRDDGTYKKSFFALQNLIGGWTTSGEGLTNQNGEFVFKGFGGNYDIDIINLATGSSTVAQAHINEQKTSNQVIKFISNSWLIEQQSQLEQLVAYWETRSDSNRVQKGQDFLALVKHHAQNSEWDLARQTLSAALDELAITTEIDISNQDLLPIGSQGEGYTMEDGSNLIWGSTTLHFPYHFPNGEVTVEITAHSKNEKGESPIMVAGVGANYSLVWKISNEQAQVYTFTTFTTGNEQDLTIRFPYDQGINERIASQNGDVGELKLFVDKVRLYIKTTQVQN